MGSRKKSSGVIGYKYYGGIHMVLCHSSGTARINRVLVGEKQLLGGRLGSSFNVDKPDLFGGDKREGGIVGTGKVMDGNPNQKPNAYLVKHTGHNIAYRGVLSVVLEDMMLAANNPYLKGWSFNVSDNLDVPAGGNTAYSYIGSGVYQSANPAYIIWKILDHAADRWGLGLDADDVIDKSNFNAVAKVLKQEEMGISLVWGNDMEAADFIELILSHIDAAIYLDHSVGKLRLKLIRDDYDANTLPVFDESIVKDVKDLKRPMWGELTTQMTVTYTEGNTGKLRPITMHNMAAQSIQGTVIPAEMRYEGFTNSKLAQRACARDLKQLSTRLMSGVLICNRKASKYNIGDVIKVNLPKYNLFNRVFRIKEKDLGTLARPDIRLTLVEDIFSTAEVTLGEDTGSDWKPPATLPTKISNQRIIEVPYWNIIQQVGDSPSAIQDLGDTFAIAGLLALQPTNFSTEFEVWYSLNGGRTYDQSTDQGFTGRALLLTELKAFANESDWITLKDIQGATAFQPNTSILIGNEWCWLTDVDLVNTRIKVRRGVIDTVPKDHIADTEVWMAGGNYTAAVDEIFQKNTTIQVKMLPETTEGTLQLNQADAVQISFQGRAYKPLVMGNYKFNGNNPGATVEGDFTISWAHRNRKTQVEKTPVFQNTGDIPPETGQFYQIEIYRPEDNKQLKVYTLITGTSQKVNFLDVVRQLGASRKVRIKSRTHLPLAVELTSHDEWDNTVEWKPDPSKPDTTTDPAGKTLILPSTESNINSYYTNSIAVYKFNVPTKLAAGTFLNVRMKASNGRPLMLVKRGSVPSSSDFDHQVAGSNLGSGTDNIATVSIPAADAGDYYVAVSSVTPFTDGELSLSQGNALRAVKFDEQVRTNVPLPTGGAVNPLRLADDDGYDYIVDPVFTGYRHGGFPHRDALLWLKFEGTVTLQSRSRYASFRAGATGVINLANYAFAYDQVSGKELTVGIASNNTARSTPSTANLSVKMTGTRKKFQTVTKSLNQDISSQLDLQAKGSGYSGSTFNGAIFKYTTDASDVGKDLVFEMITTGSNTTTFDIGAITRDNFRSYGILNGVGKCTYKNTVRQSNKYSVTFPGSAVTKAGQEIMVMVNRTTNYPISKAVLNVTGGTSSGGGGGAGSSAPANALGYGTANKKTLSGTRAVGAYDRFVTSKYSDAGFDYDWVEDAQIVAEKKSNLAEGVDVLAAWGTQPTAVNHDLRVATTFATLTQTTNTHLMINSKHGALHTAAQNVRGQGDAGAHFDFYITGRPKKFHTLTKGAGYQNISAMFNAITDIDRAKFNGEIFVYEVTAADVAPGVTTTFQTFSTYTARNVVDMFVFTEAQLPKFFAPPSGSFTWTSRGGNNNETVQHGLGAQGLKAGDKIYIFVAKVYGYYNFTDLRIRVT